MCWPPNPIVTTLQSASAEDSSRQGIGSSRLLASAATLSPAPFPSASKQAFRQPALSPALPSWAFVPDPHRKALPFVDRQALTESPAQGQSPLDRSKVHSASPINEADHVGSHNASKGLSDAIQAKIAMLGNGLPADTEATWTPARPSTSSGASRGTFPSKSSFSRPRAPYEALPNEATCPDASSTRVWWRPAATALTRMLLSGSIGCGLKMKRCEQRKAISAVGRSGLNWQLRILATLVGKCWPL